MDFICPCKYGTACHNRLRGKTAVTLIIADCPCRVGVIHVAGNCWPPLFPGRGVRRVLWLQTIGVL